jgi:diguanylate cyclase (GGDEF)-like protein
MDSKQSSMFYLMSPESRVAQDQTGVAGALNSPANLPMVPRTVIMFGRAPPPETQPHKDEPGKNQLADMALDTVAGILRNLAEFALEQEGVDLQTFRANAEAWAKHITLATAPPGAVDDDPKARAGRREWEAVRRFVRDYCQGSCARTATVTTDLRQVIWVFIRNISQAFTQDEEIDSRLGTQMGRLETLVETNATAELKREVLDAVGTFKQILKERSDRQRNQMEFLGAQVRALGDDLESARRESETDPLTRIPNRKAFDDYLARSVEIHQAFGHSTSMLIVDVDHFKTVNDTSGHITGDCVLRDVAKSLIKVFLRKNDFVARLGGDEFAVILRETSEADARTLAERVLTRVRALRVAGTSPEGLAVTVSIGVAEIAAGDDDKAWLERADRALYLAKQAGRDRAL